MLTMAKNKHSNCLHSDVVCKILVCYFGWIICCSLFFIVAHFTSFKKGFILLHF